MKIRIAEKKDAAEWETMRCALWPTGSAEHAAEISDFFAAGLGPCVVFVADSEAGLLGFLELSIRHYAEGAKGIEVPFVEGWYVKDLAQGQGVGRALMQAAVQWAKELGFKELASDTDLDNDRSIAAHQALGFRDVGRQVSFLMDL